MYTPGIVPIDPKDIPTFLQGELLALSQQLTFAQQYLFLKKSSVAPKKVRDGLLVLADGTAWNPGSGAGYYGYNAGAWHFLG
jgi:hypothetical protein